MAKKATRRTSLGPVFGTQELELLVDAKALADRTVAAGAIEDLPALDRQVSGGQIQILDRHFAAQGTLHAQVSFLGQGARVDAFGDGLQAPLAKDGNPGLLDVGASFGLSTDASAKSAGFTLSASAGASGSFRYRHYLPVAQGTQLPEALVDLVTGSRLPLLIDLGELPQPGEVHRLDTTLGLDLGLDFQAGHDTQQSVTLDFAEGLSVPFKFDVAATVKAALGLSLRDRMVIAVGRAGLLEGDGVRIRIQRENERKLSFGTTFALDLHYDLGTGLAQLFEEAVDQVPVPRLVRTAEEVTAQVAAGNWDALRARATGEVAEVLDDLLNQVSGVVTGDPDWRDWLAKDDRVAELTGFLSEVVTFYDGLDARVQGLWDRLLAKADLGQGSKVRTWLQEVAKLSAPGFDLEDLLSGEARQWVDAVEALTGRSLEEMVAGGEVKSTLTEAGDLASEALDVLTDTPSDVLAKIRAFAQATGIEQTVSVLRELDSPQKLQGTVSTRIQALAARLVGKAVDEIDPADLAKVQAWAAKVEEYLPDPTRPGTKAHELAQRIEKRLEELKLDYGLSIAFEMERVSRTTSLLDVELSGDDSRRSFRRNVGESLHGGEIRDVLEVLASGSGLVDAERKGAGADADDADEAPDFLLRECAFTSEQIRSSALTVVFDLAGLGRMVSGKETATTRRIEQATVRVQDRRRADRSVKPKAADRFVRTGRYAAGFQRAERTKALATESSIWLVCEERGQGLDLDAGYGAAQGDPGIRRSLRLAFTWEDTSAAENEIGALTKLLSDLGFQPASGEALSPRQILQRGQSVRFGFSIELDQGAVTQWLAKLSADEASWNLAFLNASYRWLAERFVTRPRLKDADSWNTWDLGLVLSTFLRTGEFRDHWLSAPDDFFQEVPNIHVEGAGTGGWPVNVEVGPLQDPTEVTGPLAWILIKRGRGLRAVEPLHKAWRKALKVRTPAAYRELSKQFVRTFKKASVHTLRWPNSMFCTWLWVAGLNVVAPELLGSARGLASLRWRTSAAEGADATWSEPEFWTLPDGVPNLLARKVLPIQDAGS